MLWADGYIDEKYQIELSLKSEDFNCIKPLLKCYGYNKFKFGYKLYKGNVFGKERGLFKISNKHLNEYLRTLGYREKSFLAPVKILEIISDKKNITKLGDYLYQDFLEFGLPRKRKIFYEIKEKYYFPKIPVGVDLNIYKFLHTVTNEIYEGRRIDFIKKYKLSPQCVYNLLHNKQFIHKNWALVR